MVKVPEQTASRALQMILVFEVSKLGMRPLSCWLRVSPYVTAPAMRAFTDAERSSTARLSRAAPWLWKRLD